MTSKQTEKAVPEKMVTAELKKIFIFSAPCVFKNVSYQPGDKITDGELIEKIIADEVFSRKGQINFL